MNSNCIADGCSAEKTRHGGARPLIRFCILVFTFLFICSSLQAEWQVGEGPLMTQ
jgi:hypothetical protein